MKYLFFVLSLLFVTPAWSQALVVATCGSGNYTADIGHLHQLTMNPAGYLCVSTTTALGTALIDAKTPAPKQPAPVPEPAK
jgi:hypothetical protein